MRVLFKEENERWRFISFKKAPNQSHIKRDARQRHEHDTFFPFFFFPGSVHATFGACRLEALSPLLQCFPCLLRSLRPKTQETSILRVEVGNQASEWRWGDIYNNFVGGSIDDKKFRYDVSDVKHQRKGHSNGLAIWQDKEPTHCSC